MSTKMPISVHVKYTEQKLSMSSEYHDVCISELTLYSMILFLPWFEAILLYVCMCVYALVRDLMGSTLHSSMPSKI